MCDLGRDYGMGKSLWSIYDWEKSEMIDPAGRKIIRKWLNSRTAINYIQLTSID